MDSNVQEMIQMARDLDTLVSVMKVIHGQSRSSGQPWDMVKIKAQRAKTKSGDWEDMPLIDSKVADVLRRRGGLIIDLTQPRQDTQGAEPTTDSGSEAAGSDMPF